MPPGYEARIDRSWAMSVTDGGAGDGVGTVSLSFRVRGLFVGQTPNDFVLLMDDDGVFADATPFGERGDYSTAEGTITFAEVDPAAGPFFALVVTPL